jgi:hypothetical protein
LQPTNDDDEVFLLQLEKSSSLKKLYMKKATSKPEAEGNSKTVAEKAESGEN